MTIALTLDTKTNTTVTNDGKGYDHTWDEATFTWDNAEGTWDTQRLLVAEEAKNNTTITNQSKT